MHDHPARIRLISGVAKERDEISGVANERVASATVPLDSPVEVFSSASTIWSPWVSQPKVNRLCSMNSTMKQRHGWLSRVPLALIMSAPGRDSERSGQH